MAPHSIRVVLHSRLDWLDVVQAVAEDLGAANGYGDDACFAIGMALREALNNAMQHGNRRDEAKKVDVTFLVYPDRLEIRVKDEGPGFDAGNLPDPLAEQNLLKPSGRGVFLIRNYMDAVDLEQASRPGGEVRMIKWRQTAAGARSPRGAASDARPRS